jgi:antitoxin MazE
VANSQIVKWGNGYGVRIPKSLLAQINLQANDEIELFLENGRLIISPVRKSSYSLDVLLSQITPENLHREIDFGRAVGKENR